MAKQLTEAMSQPRTAEELMAEYGLDAEVACVLAAVESGEALVGDIVFEPEISDEEKRRLGLGVPIEERIALARRQIAERTSKARADERDRPDPNRHTIDHR